MESNNTFKIASIYIGTVIGAGFASGQEIMQFFTRYGIHGLYGILVASLLFSLVGSFILWKVYRYQIQSYDQLIQPVLGHTVGKMIEGLLSLLLLSGYCIMLAGSGALFQQQFGLPKLSGILVMSFVTFIIFLFSIRGLAWINMVVVPILFIGIMSMGIWVIFSCGFTLSNEVGSTFNVYTGNWITSALLYVSYNSIGATVVMCSLLPLISSPNAALRGGVLGGMGLGLLAMFLLLPTLILYTDINGVEIPMMAIASKLGSSMQIGYGILLWFAMLTTAIADGFVLIQTIEKHLLGRHIWHCLFFCIAAIPLANIGFKTLVNALYPMFGYMGIGVALLFVFKR
ncbi:hypothetical protein [Geosporobacter ferrireducens]|uniref:YkvI family membrane protein n=1 Tax=Geosporobacter ferrireducens TaxID=1424294 RepID=UPI00139BA9A9|nr:hypothetical protein [Geosporobacter ferrireducens]MTI57133.1 hypothetical protein [Geosporobacter ferrireducens]